MSLLLWLLATLGGDELQALAEEGRWDDVLVEASDLLEEAAGNDTARYWLGRAWLERGRSYRANTAFSFTQDLARASLDRAVEHLTRVKEVPGEVTADAREWAVWARYLRGDGPPLAQDLERTWKDEGRAYAAFLRGRMLRDKHQEAPAALWLGRASAADPSRADYAIEWAQALAAGGRREVAAEAWRAARRAQASAADLAALALGVFPAEDQAGSRLALLDELDDPSNGWLAWYRSHALEQLGRLDEAEAVLAGATQGRGPDVDRAHARLLVQQGRYGKAAALLRPWVASGDVDALDSLLDLADELGRRRRFGEALSAYDDVLEAEPRSDRALRNRALTLWRAGRWADASRAYQQLVALWPRRPEILNDAALAALGRGHPDQARRLLERAASLYGSEDARENLAALLMASDPTRAASLLDGLLSADPARTRSLYLHFRLARSGPH